MPTEPSVARPFAVHGSDKMIYDLRMGPQGILHRGSLYAVWQGARSGDRAHPHIIRRGPDGRWSRPKRLGSVTGRDHHYAPIIWLDDREHFHVLYHCHIWTGTSRHLVSAAPLDIRHWQEAPCLAPSISYPRVLRAPGGLALLYYRVLGHMGYWTYRLSRDGGTTWGDPAGPLVDFDHDPAEPGDEWAGSYHSVVLDPDSRHLHIGFVRWDERHRINPLYRRFVNLWSRYDLYYARLDLKTGILRNIDGDRLERPLNRRIARERCLVWDTGDQLSNMPAMLPDQEGRPQFLLPVAGKRLDRCRFWFIRREGGTWQRHPVTETDNIWNAAQLSVAEDGSLSAILVATAPHAGELPYGGGALQEWRSADRGRTWRKVGDLPLGKDFLANNPKPVEDGEGRVVPRTLLCFGWQGPDGIAPEGPFHGEAFLWQDGQWR